MQRLLRFARSSIGAKFLMALTGLLMLGFLVGHLSGNLLIFKGRDAVNSYSEWLHSQGALLWLVRLGLLAVLVVHVSTALRLTRENRAARPEPYADEATVQATWASRQMVLTGLLVLAYLVYHLLHLTFHAIPTAGMGEVEMVAGADHGRTDVYAMLVGGFQNPAVAISYLVAQLLLGLHLIHGVGSMFQTFGWNHRTWKPIGAFLGFVVPVILVVGYCSIPIAVLVGAVE